MDSQWIWTQIASSKELTVFPRPWRKKLRSCQKSNGSKNYLNLKLVSCLFCVQLACDIIADHPTLTSLTFTTSLSTTQPDNNYIPFSFTWSHSHSYVRFAQLLITALFYYHIHSLENTFILPWRPLNLPFASSSSSLFTGIS